MRGISSPALFELRAQKMAECRGLAPLARRHALVSTEARFACPVGIPKWSAWGDLHSQGCSGLSRTGLLFPVNHTPVGAPGLAPPRLPDSESGPSAIRVKPHAQLEMVLPAGISLATWRFEAARSDSLSYGSMKWGRRGDSHSRGADCPAVYETAAVAAEPRRPPKCGMRNVECGMDRTFAKRLCLFIPHSNW